MTGHISQHSTYDPNTFSIDNNSSWFPCLPFKKKKEMPRRKSLKIYPQLIIGETIEDWSKKQRKITQIKTTEK